jgi:hypothetical protein
MLATKGNRDEHAGYIIALKASLNGLQWLKDKAITMLNSKQFSLWINRKNELGATVSVRNEISGQVHLSRCFDTSGFLPYTSCLNSLVRFMNRQIGDIYWSKRKLGILKQECWITPCLPLGYNPALDLKILAQLCAV